jgi:SAM-dependent methyltransferase
VKRLQRCNLCGEDVEFVANTETLGATLRKFEFPYSIDQFETLNHRHYSCPTCGASDRDRLYHLYAERHLPKDRLTRILDFAPSRTFSPYLRDRPHVSYRSADLMMADVDDVVDIMDLSIYPDESIDFFMCSHVLEHVSDDRRALAELYRVLAPGGRGIVMAPIAPRGSFDEDPDVTDEAERWRRFAQDDHVRLYDRRTFVERIRGAGFDVEMHTWRTLGPWRLRRHGVALRSVLYIAHTRT